VPSVQRLLHPLQHFNLQRCVIVNIRPTAPHRRCTLDWSCPFSFMLIVLCSLWWGVCSQLQHLRHIQRHQRHQPTSTAGRDMGGSLPRGIL
jgi:hypothetical protein